MTTEGDIMGFWTSPLSSLFGGFTRTITVNNVTYQVSASPSPDGEYYSIDLLSIPAFSQGLEIRSNDLAQIPMKLYMRTANGRQRMRNGMDAMLNMVPNKFTNAAAFWKLVGYQAVLGECFISTRNSELNILPFGSTYKYVVPETGEVRYASTYTQDELARMKIANAGPTVKDDYSYNEVLHLYMFHDEYGQPQALRDRFRHIIGLSSNLHRYATKIYNRGGVMIGFLSTDKQMKDEDSQKRIESFKRVMRSAGRQEPQIGLIDNGIKFNRLDLTPQEMMLMESKKDLAKDIYQALNIPKFKFGDLTDYKYASLETGQREYLQTSLNPLLYLIECEANAKLVSDMERPFLYTEFDRDTLISLDSKTQAEVDDLHIKNGTINTDEARERLNLPHTGNAISLVPTNMTSADYVAKNEALKLQATALDLQLKQADLALKAAQLEEMKNPPKPPADPAAPTVPAPDPSVTDPGSIITDTTNYAASLATMQDAHTKAMADKWADPTAVSDMVRSMASAIGGMHGVGGHAQLASFADKYTELASRRITGGQVNAPAELNRALNALNHHAMALARGVNAKAKWVGGANDGQVKTLSEPWQGSMRHPPIADGENNCFLIPA